MEAPPYSYFPLNILCMQHTSRSQANPRWSSYVRMYLSWHFNSPKTAWNSTIYRELESKWNLHLHGDVTFRRVLYLQTLNKTFAYNKLWSNLIFHLVNLPCGYALSMVKFSRLMTLILTICTSTDQKWTLTSNQDNRVLLLTITKIWQTSDVTYLDILCL